jgi:hypothetical protein
MAEPGRNLFSIIQKKVVTPNDFTSLARLKRTLLALIDRYNHTARPFNWKFTAADLAGLLKRISTHDELAQEPVSLPEAAWRTPTNLRSYPLKSRVGQHGARLNRSGLAVRVRGERGAGGRRLEGKPG